MRTWAALKIRIDCPECGGGINVDAPHPTVRCGECHADVPLVGGSGESLWPWIIHNAMRSKGRDGVFANTSLLDTGATVPFVYLAAHRGSVPRCPQCGDLMTALGQTADGTTGDVFCTACGAPVPTWPASYADADGDETRFQVFWAPPPGAASPASTPVASVKPVSFACPTCGGKLVIESETRRIVSCQYCDADAYLPSELWNHLHPVRRRQAFWIRAEVTH